MSVTDWLKIIDDIGGWTVGLLFVYCIFNFATAVVVTKIAKQ